MRLLLIAALSAGAAACSRPYSDPVADFSAREVTMPDGKKVRAEVMTNPTDVARGMMFRDSLPQDRGILLIYGSPGRYPSWTYQVKMPLDIIWMDQNRRVVEVSANTPPCQSTSASTCPNYGGHETALYVLEIGGGLAEKYGVRAGSVIDF